ncbi:TetR/AcrR family transcriptional regulator [Aquipuribacter sp. SD81]|uniref:TetR/AcrR family transcriptional regulator n=1 Tax=Aquipuribacter sp. SD81 TaxID=3127703 RepID=UPI003015F0DF
MTTADLVRVSRELLAEAGPQAVVVREVARRLGVSAPALYRHVRGRDDLLTLLVAACYDDVADAVEDAVARCGAVEHEERLRAATLAFRSWALANPAEFGLALGTPLAGYAAPVGGPTDRASRRLAGLFADVLAGLAAVGRLRAVPEEDLEPGLRAQLAGAVAALGLPVRPGEAYAFLVGWSRMVGLVSAEVSGQLRWAVTDSESFALRQVEDLLDDLVLTRPGPPDSARPS